LKQKGSTVRIKFALGIVAAIIFSMVAPGTVVAQDFFLRVLTDERFDWTSDPSLTLIAEPGGENYREIVLTNNSPKSLTLNLTLANSKETDGVISIDDEVEPTIAPFVSFSEDPVLMEPGSVKTVRISLSTPQDTTPFSETSYLMISTEPKLPQNDSGQGVQAYLPIVNRVAYPIFVGVGNYGDFDTNFTIDSVDFSASPEGNSASLWITNNGKLELPVEGFLKFQDAAFDGQVFGPFNFAPSTIPAESSAFVTIPLPEQIIESRWRVFAQVDSNNVIKTNIFEEDVSFSSFSIGNTAIYIVIFFISVAAFIWSVRQFRHRAKKSAGSQTENPQGSLEGSNV
jgi:hypothetical protein